jgi:dTDP-4-amino-4,6-dideoxygalactose transaminase
MGRRVASVRKASCHRFRAAVSPSAVPIPLFDIQTPLRPLRPRLIDAAARTLDGGAFILGPEVTAFEREFADFLGVKHVLGVANGTDALTVALRAMGVGPGDDVVIPSFTFYASAEAIPPTGARPVFCDVDPETMMVTPETVKRALTPATKAVIVVHLFGNVAPVADIEALSDDAVAEMAAVLRFHGSRDRETWEFIGYNSRLDELQAAFLRVLLPELDGWSADRMRAAGHYQEAGLGELVTLPSPTEGASPAWHVYVIRWPDVDAIAAELSRAQVGNKVYYRPPLHHHPALRQYAAGVQLPATEELALSHLAIAFGPRLSDSDAAQVTAHVRGALSKRQARGPLLSY